MKKNFKTLNEEVNRMKYLFDYAEGSLIAEAITPEDMVGIERVTIEGSVGAGKAKILIDDKDIKAQGLGYKVYKVQVEGDKVRIYATSILGDADKTMGHFAALRNGGYRFVQTTDEEKTTYAAFKKKASADQYAIFSVFTKASAEHPAFARAVLG